MSPAENTHIHRYLDEAFAGIAMTPDVQDLKEEIRGNLGARAGELEANGKSPADAAAAAVKELGNIQELVASIGDTTLDAAALNRVKPKPAFVVRTVIFSLLTAGGAVLVTLAAFGVVSLTVGIVAAIVTAISVGMIVHDSLGQETSHHYPLPNRRSVPFAIAAILMTLGVSFAALYFVAFDLWLIVTGSILAFVAIIAFVWLGVTQTNRTKPWALEQQREYMANDRFSNDPAAAARFGIFTVVIWTVAFTVFGILSVTAGFAWSWLAIVGGFVVFMSTLAIMNFPTKK
jgi:MFS family permease